MDFHGFFCLAEINVCLIRSSLPGRQTGVFLLQLCPHRSPREQGQKPLQQRTSIQAKQQFKIIQRRNSAFNPTTCLFEIKRFTGSHQL